MQNLLKEKINDVMPLNVYCSYAEKDEAYFQLLDKHMAAMRDQGLILDWDNGKINAGYNFAHAVNEQLDKADLYLMLISPDFIASKYHLNVEVKKALQRHQEGKAQVLPIIIRPSDWKNTPLGNLKPLPKDGKALTTWENMDEGFLNVVQGIRTLLNTLGRVKMPLPEEANLFSIVLEGTLVEFDNEKLEAVMKTLREVSKDITMKITNIKPGSVVLYFTCKEEGFKKLLDAYLSDELYQVAGHIIKKMEVIDNSLPDSEKSASHYFQLINPPRVLGSYEIRVLFGSFGKVKTLHMARTSILRGGENYAYVELETRNPERVLHFLNDFKLAGEQLVVKLAEHYPEQSLGKFGSDIASKNIEKGNGRINYN